MMAEAYGKMTGSPGVCFVTRGPGSTNGRSRHPYRPAGFHAAGDVRRPDRHPPTATARRFRRSTIARSLAGWRNGRPRWTATDRLPEYIARAFRVATTGRPGPVVLALPEDMFVRPAPMCLTLPGRWIRPRPDLMAAARAVMEALKGAERPLVVVGGPHWSAQAAQDLARFAEGQGLPVALGFRRQGLPRQPAPALRGRPQTSVSIRVWPRGCGLPMRCWSSGHASVTSKRKAIPCSTPPPPPSGSSTSTPMPMSPAGSGAPIWW